MAAHPARALLLGALFSLAIVASANTQPAPPDDKIAIAFADRISRDIAAGEVDGAIAKVADAIKTSPQSIQILEANAQTLKTLGKSHYVERVYARDFGRTTKDLIDKIQFDRTPLYVRYIFTVYKDEWRLQRFNFETAITTLPSDWGHIYP
ncbi:MAG: hypothetical protein GEU91_07285 [Rhizobiales bacterium]|nr:hypothetical protein [Hyphomicrobiales bacterium]